MADQSGPRTLGRDIRLDEVGRDIATAADRLSAFRDLRDRLRDCQGAANLIATVVGMAASAADELSDVAVASQEPERPEAVPQSFTSREEHGAHVVRNAAGETIAFAESADNAATVTEALNVLTAIRLKESL